MALPVRKGYSGTGVSTTLTSSPTLSDTTFTVTATTNWSTTYPFFIVVDPGTTKEEKMKVTGVSSLTVTVVRGQDGTSAVAHTSGAVCYPVFTALEADEANKVASAMTTKGDIIATDGSSINRLGVGTNSYVLQADSSSTNGIKWAQVATAGITDAAVTSDKIASSAVITAKLNDGAITTAKLNDGAVTVAKLAAAATPGLVHLNTTTISSAVTTVISNVFSSTYDSYKIIIRNIQRVSAGSGCSCFIRLAAGGSEDTDLNYFSSTMASGFSAAGTVSYSGASNADLWLVVDADGSHKASCEIELINPYVASPTHGRFNAINTAGSTFGSTWFGFLGNSESTSYDGFAVIGAVAINATVSVYGYKN